jgi:DNA-binding MarR family transcriptional regulator
LKERCRVSSLAQEFDLTQATVSDAIKVLTRKGLTTKKPSQLDGRAFTLKLTSSGKRLAIKLSGWQAGITEQIKGMLPDRKESTIIFLTDLIALLQRGGIISTARMCISCSFFRRDAYPGSERPHHCALTGRSIADSGVEIDCDKYDPVDD